MIQHRYGDQFNLSLRVGPFLTCGGLLHEPIHGDWREVHRFPLVCGSGNDSSDSVWSHTAVPAGRPLPHGRLPASSVHSHLVSTKTDLSESLILFIQRLRQILVNNENNNNDFSILLLVWCEVTPHLQNRALWVVHWSELPAPYQSGTSKLL